MNSYVWRQIQLISYRPQSSEYFKGSHISWCMFGTYSFSQGFFLFDPQEHMFPHTVFFSCPFSVCPMKPLGSALFVVPFFPSVLACLVLMSSYPQYFPNLGEIHGESFATYFFPRFLCLFCHSLQNMLKIIHNMDSEDLFRNNNSLN